MTANELRQKVKVSSLVTVSLLLMIVSSGSYANLTSSQQRFSIDGNSVQLVFGENFSTSDKAKLKQWIEYVAIAVGQVYGQLPLKSTLIKFKRSNKAREPVPYAYVLRDQRSGIVFYVNPAFPLEDFINDWTAYHEFSHLMIPYPGNDDIWFSEGLASYYQNIIMAREGLITPLKAWQKLYAGFMRGSNDNSMQQLTLAQLSPDMRETGSFMRVYWSGAYYFSSVDISLRKQGKNLDQVMQAIKQCCLQQQRQWSGMDLARQMDSLSSSRIFSDHFETIANSFQMPDSTKLLLDIGLKIDNDTVSVPPGSNRFFTQMMQPLNSL